MIKPVAWPNFIAHKRLSKDLDTAFSMGAKYDLILRILTLNFIRTNVRTLTKRFSSLIVIQETRSKR